MQNERCDVFKKHTRTHAQKCTQHFRVSIKHTSSGPKICPNIWKFNYKRLPNHTCVPNVVTLRCTLICHICMRIVFFFKYAVRKQIELHKHAVCSSIPPLNLRLHVTFQGRQKLNWLIILKPIIGRGWHAREISADEGQSKDVLSRRSLSLQETHHAVGETAWHFRNSTSLRRAACTPILCPASAILSFDFFFRLAV